MFRRLVLIAAASFPALAAATAARGVTLYDGSLGTAPEQQGWLTYQSFGTVTKTTDNGQTTLDTAPGGAGAAAGFATYSYNPINQQATIVNPALPAFDRTAGFTVELDMRVLSESHNDNDRAGVDLIVISQAQGGQTLGIELGFWADRVWAQNANFTHAAGLEDAAYTTTNATRYELDVQGTTYSLTANGATILSGPLRDYTAQGVPYTLSNFLFLGDNTSRAAGSFEFSRLAVIPEPAGAALMFLTAAGAALGRRRQR